MGQHSGQKERGVGYKEPMPFAPAEYRDRIARVRKGMQARGLDALVLTTPENVYYLSNHHTPAYDAFQALLLPLDGEPMLITPLIEELIGRGHSWVERFATYRHGEPPISAMRVAFGDAGQRPLAAGVHRWRAWATEGPGPERSRRRWLAPIRHEQALGMWLTSLSQS